MYIRNFGIQGNWEDVKESARVTIGKDGVGKTPPSEWKRSILLAEHSPIREIIVKWIWESIPSWIATHFIRHNVGVNHFQQTQRSDRTGVSRDEKRQDEPVKLKYEANAQAMINISRKRLCNQAAPETRKAWEEVVELLKDREPELYSVCVPECIYRGFCPEIFPCGYAKTEEYRQRLAEYRKGHE